MASRVKKLDDQKKLEEVKAKFDAMLRAEANWRTQKATYEAYYDGDQLTRQEIDDLEKRGQPAIVINRIKPALDLTFGLQRQFRRHFKAYPAETPEDEATAEAITGLLRAIEYENEFYFEESECFQDGIKTGRGWFHVWLDADEYLDPVIKTESVPSSEIFKDPLSRRYDLRDARCLGRSFWTDYEDLKGLFPDKEKEIDKAKVFQESIEKPGTHENLNQDQYSSNNIGTWIDSKRDRIRVVEYWYRKKAKRSFILHEELGAIRLEKFDNEAALKKEISRIQEELKKDFGSPGKAFDRIVDVMFETQFIANTILDEKEVHFNHGQFPYIPYFAYRKESTGENYGVIKQMMDPQNEINKRRSKALHYSISDLIIADDQAVADEEKARREVARPDGYIKVRPGRKFELHTKRELASTQMQLYEAAVKEITDGTGFNQDMMGYITNARSGEAIRERKQPGILILSEIFDNFKRTKLMVGKQWLSLIQQYYTQSKIQRVFDNRGKAQFIPINKKVQTPDGKIYEINNIKTGKYDLMIEEGVDSINIGDEVRTELAKMGQTGMIPPEVVIEFLNLPVEIKENILQTIQQAKAQQVAMAQATAQQEAVGQPASPAAGGEIPASTELGAQ